MNFGSRYVVPLRKPAIALAWDRPASPASAGAARFVLERQYGYPVTPVRTAMLGSTAFARSFQVLILPEGGDYAEELGEDGIARLKAWVESGGTIVALGNAVNFLSDSHVGLLELKQEKALREGEEKETAAPDKTGKPAEGMVAGTRIANESDMEKVSRAGTELPDDAPGALLRARVRPNHWLTAGVPETVNLMVEGRAIYSPVKADRGVNAVYFDGPGQLVVSGHLWSENQQQIAYKPAVVAATAGRGVVVAFTQDPNFRAMLDGANVLFLNAVFRGPAHARGSGSEE